MKIATAELRIPLGGIGLDADFRLPDAAESATK